MPAALAGPQAGLLGLFLASFLAATLLPGGSEAVLFALLVAHPERAMAALLLATAGNTLGGMTTYAMARLLPQKAPAARLATARRWGAPVLLFAWAPVVGDALCAAAGWLRLPWPACALWMAVGKGIRYGLVAAAAGAL
ncbi:MAG: DedA family protein [Rhodocyclaceae bacterium]|nr:DedA family protein [Rhodocyclaceae bacterium]